MVTARFLHVRIDDLLTIYPITGLTWFKIVNILMRVMYNVIYIYTMYRYKHYTRVYLSYSYIAYLKTFYF